MSVHWHIGMKLVCVDPGAFTNFLTKDAVYTLRAMNGDYVYLEERSTFGIGGSETAGFRHHRFRPVQTRKTDISILKAILLNPHIPVREDA